MENTAALEGKILTPREAAKHLIRKEMLKGDVIHLRFDTVLQKTTADFSVHREKHKIVVARFYGVPIREEFLISDIKKDILLEVIHNPELLNPPPAKAAAAF